MNERLTIVEEVEVKNGNGQRMGSVTVYNGGQCLCLDKKGRYLGTYRESSLEENRKNAIDWCIQEAQIENEPIKTTQVIVETPNNTREDEIQIKVKVKRAFVLLWIAETIDCTPDVKRYGWTKNRALTRTHRATRWKNTNDGTNPSDSIEQIENCRT